jgi:hypothetical protein
LVTAFLFRRNMSRLLNFLLELFSLILKILTPIHFVVMSMSIIKILPRQNGLLSKLSITMSGITVLGGDWGILAISKKSMIRLLRISIKRWVSIIKILFCTLLWA